MARGPWPGHPQPIVRRRGLDRLLCVGVCSARTGHVAARAAASESQGCFAQRAGEAAPEAASASPARPCPPEATSGCSQLWARSGGGSGVRGRGIEECEPSLLTRGSSPLPPAPPLLAQASARRPASLLRWRRRHTRPLRQRAPRSPGCNLRSSIAL